MASMKAKIEIGLDTSKIKSGSKEATQSFDKIASGAKSALGKVDARADKAGNKIKQVGNEGKIAGSKVKQGAEKGAQGMNKLGNEAKKAERDIGGVAISVMGLGASVTGLSDTIFGMKEKMVALERSSFGLQRTTEDMKRMQEDFDEAVASGTMTVKEHARAVKDLELGYLDMAVEVKEIEAETEAMNSEWMSFAVNSMTTVLFAITTVKSALDAQTISTLKASFASLKLKLSNIGVAVSALTASSAIGIMTMATKAFGLALWSLVKHPVFMVVAGALAIWESNLFGVRTEIEKLTGIGDLSILSNIQKSFDTGIPEAGAETIDTLETIEEKTLALQETLDETTTQSNKGIIPMIEDVGDCSVKSAKKVDSLTDSLDNLKKKQETFRADYVASELRFQQQVKRVKNKSMSPQAYQSGLASLVNYNKMLGGTMNFGHSLTSKFTDPMDHWNRKTFKYKMGGNEAQNFQERHDQKLYNDSISGFDNNSTKGWSKKALDTQRAFHDRVARKNAIASAKYDAQREEGKRRQKEMYAFARKWGIVNRSGTKAGRRAIPHFVRLKKLRIKFLQDQGYQGIVNPDGLSRAEEQFAKDNDWFLTTSGLGQERLDTIYEEKRRHDIYNVINHRARLGQLSSGVI